MHCAFLFVNVEHFHTPLKSHPLWSIFNAAEHVLNDIVCSASSERMKR